MENTKKISISTPGIHIATVALVLLWLLHLLPFLLPEARLWGFNHLRFLSPYYLYAYLIGGLISLALLFPPLRNLGRNVFEAIAASLFEKQFRFRWLIMAAGSLIVFWIFRLPIFLLGDSYSIVENIGNELPVIFKWSEIGAIYLAYFVARLIPVTGSQLGEYAYGAIAVISGGFTVYIFFALAYELGKDAAGRFLIFCLSIFAGWMVLFFGYTENYSVLWPFVTGYVYFAVKYINRKGDLLWPTLMVILALVLHLQVLFFLISYPILIVARGKTARFYHKFRRIIWPGVAVMVIAALVIFIQQYRNSLELQLYIMPLFQGHPATPYYALFSIPHLLDILSQLLIVVPLLPALVILGWRGWRVIVNDKADLFLLLLTFGGIVFLFIIDPKLGLGRDWDLFALSGLPPMLLFVKNIADDAKITRALFPTLALMSLVLVMPFVATNLSRQPAIDNYKYLLNLDLPKGRPGVTILRKIAKAENDSLLADSLKTVLVESYPAVHQAPRAFELAEQGRFAEALILVDSMAMFNPISVEVYNLRGTVYLKMGRYAKAVQDLEKAAQLGRYDARLLSNLAQAYNLLGQTDRMMDVLRKGQRRNPDMFEIKVGLMSGFHAQRQFDSSLVYAQRIIQERPSFEAGYWFGGYAAMQLGDRTKAKIYLTRFAEMAPDDASRQRAEELLQQLQ